MKSNSLEALRNDMIAAETMAKKAKAAYDRRVLIEGFSEELAVKLGYTESNDDEFEFKVNAIALTFEGLLYRLLEERLLDQ